MTALEEYIKEAAIRGKESDYPYNHMYYVTTALAQAVQTDLEKISDRLCTLEATQTELEANVYKKSPRNESGGDAVSDSVAAYKERLKAAITKYNNEHLSWNLPDTVFHIINETD